MCTKSQNYYWLQSDTVQNDFNIQTWKSLLHTITKIRYQPLLHTMWSRAELNEWLLATYFKNMLPARIHFIISVTCSRKNVHSILCNTIYFKITTNMRIWLVCTLLFSTSIYLALAAYPPFWLAEVILLTDGIYRPAMV